MSLWGSIKKGFGIAKMNAEEAAENAIDPVDAANLQIKNDEEALKVANVNLTKARKDYYAEKIQLDKARNNIIELQQKAQQLVANYRAQGLDDQAIGAKIAPIQASMTEDINKNNHIIQTKEQTVAQIEGMVKQFEAQIKQFSTKISQRKNQVKMLETRHHMVDTKEKIASAMSNLNVDGTADDLLRLEASIEAKEANSAAIMDQSAMHQSGSDKLEDMLIASSSSTASDPFASLLGAPEQKKIG